MKVHTHSSDFDSGNLPLFWLPVHVSVLNSTCTVHDGVHTHQQLTVMPVDQSPSVFLYLLTVAAGTHFHGV